MRSHASMSRNSQVTGVAAGVAKTSFQCRPPSVVRSTVPSVPLTQATCRETGARPRNCASDRS